MLRTFYQKQVRQMDTLGEKIFEEPHPYLRRRITDVKEKGQDSAMNAKGLLSKKGVDPGAIQPGLPGSPGKQVFGRERPGGLQAKMSFQKKKSIAWRTIGGLREARTVTRPRAS